MVIMNINRFSKCSEINKQFTPGEHNANINDSDEVLENLKTVATILQVYTNVGPQQETKMNLGDGKQRNIINEEKEDVSGTYVVSEAISPNNDWTEDISNTKLNFEYTNNYSYFPYVEEFIRSIAEKNKQFPSRKFEAFWVSLQDCDNGNLLLDPDLSQNDDQRISKIDETKNINNTIDYYTEDDDSFDNARYSIGSESSISLDDTLFENDDFIKTTNETENNIIAKHKSCTESYANEFVNHLLTEAALRCEQIISRKKDVTNDDLPTTPMNIDVSENCTDKIIIPVKFNSAILKEEIVERCDSGMGVGIKKCREETNGSDSPEVSSRGVASRVVGEGLQQIGSERGGRDEPAVPASVTLTVRATPRVVLRVFHGSPPRTRSRILSTLRQDFNRPYLFDVSIHTEHPDGSEDIIRSFRMRNVDDVGRSGKQNGIMAESCVKDNSVSTDNSVYNVQWKKHEDVMSTSKAHSENNINEYPISKNWEKVCSSECNNSNVKSECTKSLHVNKLKIVENSIDSKSMVLCNLGESYLQNNGNISENVFRLNNNSVMKIKENGEVSPSRKGVNNVFGQPVKSNEKLMFEYCDGAEKFVENRATARKLVSSIVIRAGNGRVGRRRVPSIRRPPSRATRRTPCARCLLFRVAPSGPLFLLHLSAGESKSEKSFRNKLFSLEHFCSCARNVNNEQSAKSCGVLDEKNNYLNSLQLTNIGADKSVIEEESEIITRKPSNTNLSEKLIELSLTGLNKNNIKKFQNNFSSHVEFTHHSNRTSPFTEDSDGKADGVLQENAITCETKNNKLLLNHQNQTVKGVTNSQTESCFCKCHCDKSEQEKTEDDPKNIKTNNISNDNYNSKNIFSDDVHLLDSQENAQKDSLEYLSSKILNSFEVSSRLKRLEEKLRSSVDSLKDSEVTINNSDCNINEEVKNSDYILKEAVDDQSNLFINDKLEESVLSLKDRCDNDIVLYSESIKNNLEDFLKIHRDLKINKYCSESLEINNSEICPAKNLYEESKNCVENNTNSTSIDKDLRNFDDIDSDLTSDNESRELEEFERQERWASNEDYFEVNADLFSSSSCQFTASEVDKLDLGLGETLKCYDELWDSSESLSSEDEETVANTLANSNMRGEGPAADRRHNKDASNLKSLLKKATRKGKKNRVVFNENRNEFFEADYIILIREECQYDEESDEGVCTCSQHEMVRLACCEEDCNGCESEECNPEPEQVTLSPPEGYKDSGLFNKDGTFKEQGLFNKDGTLRDQGLFARPGGLLVGEASGTVFSPQHLHQLQLIQRLQREQLRRAKAALTTQDGSTTTTDEGLEDQVEDDGPDEEVDMLPAKSSYAKEIVAGEERPKVNSGQQTTPTDEIQLCVERVSLMTQPERRNIQEPATITANDDMEEIRSEQSTGHQSSPMRLGGILKGGRLWKASVDGPPIPTEQTEEASSFRDSASDEEGKANRAVRFTEPPPQQTDSQLSSVDEPSSDSQDQTDSSPNSAKAQELTLTFRLGSHLLSNNSLRPNSAVRQLFPSGPHFVSPSQRTEADKQYLVTAESLRAFEEGKRSKLPTNYRDEDLTVRRTIDRNTLRRSLVKVDQRKKTPMKNDTSLSERIKMLTCNIEDEEATTGPTSESDRCNPSTEENHPPVQAPSKCFSPSSSSSSASSCSSTSSTYKKLTDIFPKRQDRIPECNEEGNGVVIIPQGDKLSGSVMNINIASRPGDINSSLEQPAPDVLAGTPGAGDGDELARFVQQESARTERLRKRYQQPSTENSDDDDQDDYGFSDRPTVRGIKPRFGSTNEILQQMQSQLMPQPATRPGHISWPYYSESNLTMPAGHDHNMLHHNVEPPTNRPLDDYQQQAAIRMRERERLNSQDQRELHNLPQHMIDPLQENIYQNCMAYVNVRCNGSERDMYVPQAGHVHSYTRSHRRPESPPPIRSYHQTMVLLPYSNLPHQPHYSNTSDRAYMGIADRVDQNGLNIGEYQPPQYTKGKEQIVHMKQSQQSINLPYQPAGIPMQLKCSAPMAHIRTVQPRPLAHQMICFSEKVQGPLYQAAPGSPVVAGGGVRGVPEGAPAPAASPTTAPPPPHPQQQHNALYYAMNV